MKKMKKMKLHLLICIFFILSCHDNKSKILDDESHGYITKIYIDKKNHSIYKFDIITNYGYNYFVADLYPYSWEYASVGDSVIKKKGDAFITVKKKDGRMKIFETRIK